MTTNPHTPEHADRNDPDQPVQPSAQLPGRVDAGDGQVEYVYKRRGLFSRIRARVGGMVQQWLVNAVPPDEDQPPQPGTATYVLAGTWKRRLVTLTAASLVVMAMIAALLVL